LLPSTLVSFVIFRYLIDGDEACRKLPAELDVVIRRSMPRSSGGASRCG
jgi:hypothetical protein